MSDFHWSSVWSSEAEVRKRSQNGVIDRGEGKRSAADHKQWASAGRRSAAKETHHDKDGARGAKIADCILSVISENEIAAVGLRTARYVKFGLNDSSVRRTEETPLC